jgi:hypothetical protein
MPFSRIAVYACEVSSIIKIIKIVTLQVRTFSNLSKSCCTKEAAGKRVFLSASGSVTLEAALCLSIFIFASTCLMLPMKVMNTERQIQAAMEQAGEDLSRYAYLKDAAEQGKLFASVGAGDFAKGFCNYLAEEMGEGYTEALVWKHMKTNVVTRISMTESQIMTDGEYIDLIMNYEIRFPFPVLGLSSLERTARCRRRAWIGMEGKDFDSDGEASSEEDPMVYIGKRSTRYHRKRSCHYLSNDLTAVSRNAISAMRNKDGEKYRACAVCGKQAGETLYIMPSGESYHMDPDCRAIVAYVQTAHLSEVEYLGPCSYCSK